MRSEAVIQARRDERRAELFMRGARMTALAWWAEATRRAASSKAASSRRTPWGSAGTSRSSEGGSETAPDFFRLKQI
jgi:hypothetical protein